MKKIILLLIITLSLSACVRVQYAAYDSERRSPNVTVDVYNDASNIRHEYKEIGSVIAKGENNEALMIREMRKKAGTQGADAIIIQRSSEIVGGVVPIGGTYVVVHKRAMRAIAIVYIGKSINK